MKGLVIAGLLMLAGWPGLTAKVATPVFLLAMQAQAEATGESQGEHSMGGDIGTAHTIAQTGAIGILAVVLFFYRRDFFTQREREQEEKRRLIDVLEKNTECITQSNVAIARQTDATHRLARAVENIERQQAGMRPHTGGGTT